MRSILVLALLLGGCGKKEDPGEKAATEYVAKYAAESVTKDLAHLKTAIASPKPSDGIFKCAGSMASIDVLEKSSEHKALAAELRTLCTKDLYLAMIKVEVEKAEAARKAKPDDQALSECYNADFEFARDKMKEAKTVDAAKDLIARFEVACPSKK